LEHNLYFERFLNPERSSPPDIDLDFNWRRRDEALEYVYNRFGRDRVAMICSYVTFAARSSVREVCKALGIPDNEIKRITQLIPHLRTTGNISGKHPECRELNSDTEPIRTILNITRRIAGFPRHLSVHAGGIVIAPRPLTDFLPLEMATKGLVVTQYDMYGAENVGLIKLDLLCQRSLGVLEDSHRAAEEHAEKEIDVYNYELSLNDETTRRMIREGRTMGCFYIESPGMRNLLRKLHTETFEDLTAASSVIRPGVAESGMMDQYIERHRDPGKIEYLHPLMEELLGETHGVMIYQEDVLKVAHHLGGLTLGEADLLRRAMSGKLRSRTAMESLKSNFLRSCLEKGIDPEVVMEIWRQVSSFAGYAFCKAHSASYALLSFQCTYMKAHFPAEFMAGVLSNQGGFYGAGAYIQEARRLGLQILLPDINHSEHDYIGHDDWIRIGLMAIRGLRWDSLKSILRAREESGPFEDLDDFLKRTDVGFEEARGLIRLGAMESLGRSRPDLMAQLYASPLAKDKSVRDKSREPILLDAPREEISVPADCCEYTLRQKCAIEAETLGYLVTAHPLDLFGPILSKYDLVSASKLEQYAGKRVRMAGWMIAARRIRTRRGDRYMKFMSMEDKTGTFEVTLFPNSYRRLAPKTMGQGPYVFEGTVDDHFGVCSLNCKNLYVLERLPPEDGEKLGPDVREMGISKMFGPGGFGNWSV
jgi:DNA-directed DNA polymerase III PolC